MNFPNRVLVDESGVIYSVYPDGRTNHPSEECIHNIDTQKSGLEVYESLSQMAENCARHQEARSRGARYFVNQDGLIFAVFENGESNFKGFLEIRIHNSPGRSDEAWELGEDEGNGERLVVDEYPLWDSLRELADAIEGRKAA